MNLSALVNGCFVREEDVFKIIEEDCMLNRIPIMVFVNMTNVQLSCKIVRFITHVNKFENLNSVEFEIFDRKVNDMYESPLWLNDTIIKSMDDYNKSGETIINENIKHVFVDILPDTISKLDVIKWSEETGFNVYFTNFTLNKNPYIMDDIQDLIKKADSGDAEAQFDLATAYFLGNSVKEDKTEALKYFLKAAEQEVPLAMFYLGLMYRDGYGTRRNWCISMYWLWKAYRYEVEKAKTTIDQMRLWIAKEWRTLESETISLDIHREIESYKEEKYKSIYSFIADCRNRKIYSPNEFIDVDSDNGRKIINLNVYPYHISINHNGLEEYICSHLLQFRASELWGIDSQKAHGYLDASIELLKDLSESWVADSYMSYYQLKGQYYMNERKWDKATVAFKDFIDYQYCCYISKFAKDDEDIFERMTEEEQKELCDSETSFYDAHVSLIVCSLQQEKTDKANQVVSELLTFFKTRVERQDSWSGDWLLDQFKNENKNDESPNLIRTLKNWDATIIWMFCLPYYSLIEKGIGNGYDWTREQYELVEAMFQTTIPIFEQNREDYNHKRILTSLNFNKGVYMSQTRRFVAAEKLFLNAISLLKEQLSVERAGNIDFIAEIIGWLDDLYRVQNQKAEKQDYLWSLMTLFQENEKCEDYYLTLKEKLEQK